MPQLVRLLLAIVLIAVSVRTARAQARVTFKSDVTFYGDNTEFFNPFRKGETLLGTAGRFFFDVRLNERVSLRAGLFGNHRNGSQDLFEQWRPVLGLVINVRKSEFLFGTIDSGDRRAGIGPDRTGPHGLPPPLQRETLAFTRPYEAGLQWKLTLPQVEQDAWLNWQQLNTKQHRERFDAGLSGRTPLPATGLHTKLPRWLTWRVHLVHEGGQLFDVGPVDDSIAGGPGIVIERPVWRLDKGTAELQALWSRYEPDRQDLDDAMTGFGWFLRFAGERGQWRGHLLVWRATDFMKLEGDANYLSHLQTGGFFRAPRHYGEMGLARSFQPAPDLNVEGSLRLHHVQGQIEYSYRILAIVHLEMPLTRKTGDRRQETGKRARQASGR